MFSKACFGMQNDSITKENNLKKFVFESLRGLNRLLFNPTIKVAFIIIVILKLIYLIIKKIK